MTTPPLAAVGSIISLEVLSNEKFAIGKVLGGGMGTVYQLVPVKPGRLPLALKTFQQFVDRPQFLREAELWISLGTHPHIAHAFACTEWLDQPCIIADWYDKSLEEIDLSLWASSDIVGLSLQLIEGLQYAHERSGVVHQDVKPSNVLIDIHLAPRLADFGMARFSSKNLVGVGRISDVQVMMHETVSLGPIGGTPIYMAPELFLGDRPSVRTDIFSLGVTLYRTLTGQFPFAGPETGYRFRPALRNDPLKILLRERGEQIKPLVALLVSALELDPARRPKTYRDLLSTAGLRRAPSQKVIESAQDIVARAAFLRKEARYDQAIELLREALQDRPTDPILLNSYGVLLLSQKREEEAQNVLEMAVESLRMSSGAHDGRLYLDPLVNLARRYIIYRQFKQAEDLLRLAWGWSGGGRTNDLRADYVEFGWLFLYSGRFDDACKHILQSYRHRAADEASLLWLTLAAWLSGAFLESAESIARHYMALERMETQCALCACVVASSLPTGSGRRLLEKAYRSDASGLRDAARELGLNVSVLEIPIPDAAQEAVIRSLDAITTGGKNRDAIG